MISLVSNLDIHEHLYVSHIKIRHTIVHTWVLVVIQTRLEYLGGSLPLALTLRLSCLSHFLLQCLIVLSESAVLWFELYGLPAVSKSLRVILEMQVGQGAQVQSLLRSYVDLESGSAVFTGLDKVACLCLSKCYVLQNELSELLRLLRVLT